MWQYTIYSKIVKQRHTPQNRQENKLECGRKRIKGKINYSEEQEVVERVRVKV